MGFCLKHEIIHFNGVRKTPLNLVCFSDPTGIYFFLVLSLNSFNFNTFLTKQDMISFVDFFT